MKRLLALAVLFCMACTIASAGTGSREICENLFLKYCDLYKAELPKGPWRSDNVTRYTIPSGDVVILFDETGDAVFAQLKYYKPFDIDFVKYGTCMITPFFGEESHDVFLLAMTTYSNGEGYSITLEKTLAIVISAEEYGIKLSVVTNWE